MPFSTFCLGLWAALSAPLRVVAIRFFGFCVSGAAPRLDEPRATKNGVDDDSYASRAHRREKLTVTKSGVVDVDVEANGRFSAGQDLGELMLPVSLELKD